MGVCVGVGGRKVGGWGRGEEQQGDKAGSFAAVYTAMFAWIFDIVQHTVTAVGRSQADIPQFQCTNASGSGACLCTASILRMSAC